MTRLRISDHLKLPLEAVTETFAILGRRGSGKTHTAVVMAEEMLAAGVPVVVIDPLDVWWGLRVSKDGKSAGFPIYVCGGSHEDVPLTADAGKVLADAIVDRALLMVLSLRHLSKSDQRRFVGDFCERLYDRKADPQHRTALHVFIDEADAFVPQRLMPGAERCFGAVDTLVRRGRSSGLAPTLISQRPQVINKDVLSQTEVLVSHQLTGPQDRKALEAWIEANDTENRRAEFMASLASLPKGSAWFWSPGLLGIFKRIEVRDRTTFDSSATPKAGVRAVASPKAFAAVDLEALTAEIAATIEKAKADDPRELRKQIAELKRQIAKPAPTPRTETQIVERFVMKDGQIDRVEKVMDKLSQMCCDVLAAIRKTHAQPVHKPLTIAARSVPVRQPRPAVAHTESDLSGPEQRIVDAIAWLESLGIMEAEQTAVAFLANYTYGAGSFNNPRGSLRVKGLVEYLPNNRISLTDAGRAVANVPEAALTAEELHARVLERLPGPEQRLLRPLLAAYPEVMSNDDLAAAANYAAGAGSFNNPRGRLRSLGLIDYKPGGFVVAKSLLFLE